MHQHAGSPIHVYFEQRLLDTATAPSLRSGQVWVHVPVLTLSAFRDTHPQRCQIRSSVRVAAALNRHKRECTTQGCIEHLCILCRQTQPSHRCTVKYACVNEASTPVQLTVPNCMKSHNLLLAIEPFKSA